MFVFPPASASAMMDGPICIIKQFEVLVKRYFVILSGYKTVWHRMVSLHVWPFSKLSEQESGHFEQALLLSFPRGVSSHHLLPSNPPPRRHSRPSPNYTFTPAGANVCLKWLFLPHRRLLLVIICIVIKFDEVLRDIKSHLTQVPLDHVFFAHTHAHAHKKRKNRPLKRRINLWSCGWQLGCSVSTFAHISETSQ